ncbi:Holliday junction resolvase RuvX [Rhodohalobacter sulfatireducens]|uniref:Putative pre-16S rRNA nuclease n=1 Tax=Rhodohalobacter sulfatireducens TaxID=2911366 RepID=A0ABS9KCQ1_9BACT|nr:Holliday junction resolvase RuvX [Rhodohalobacter sulfatireducens]MCG2588629.1 Holliday junction resolvase RuvX [Rhodohalobacter sulfatireducens]MDR9363830.1 Holliday junction resolvase RuvX [Balneolaceae bacterium]
MSEFGRILGVDVGSKRVGLARTDLLRTNANPFGTFPPNQSIREIEKQVKNEGPVKAIVVGWPLTPQGDPTNATGLVENYIKSLEKKFRDIKIYKMDERYTSRQAQNLLVEAGVPKKKRREKGRVDQAAAALILQQFLEAHPEI